MINKIFYLFCPILIISIIVITCRASVVPSTVGGTCYTEQGLEGMCLPLRQCPKLKRLISSLGGITRETADLLRKKVCNKSFYEAHLCCPNEVRKAILPPENDCGIPRAVRITKGQNYTHGVHPWLVGLAYLKRDGTLQVECGGTLITKRHVLTAAHCFSRRPRDRIPQLTHVILGEHSLSRDIERERPIILKISERKDAGYQSSYYNKDISLLVLEKDVAFSEYIQPACLPFNKDFVNFNPDNEKMIIAGWGKTSFTDAYGTDTPLEAFVSMFPLSKCQEAYKKAKIFTIDETQICLGGDGKDSCKGDSGGPVIFKEKEGFHRHFVIGITAFGGVCGDPDYPGVYTYVPAYMDWIIENL